MKEEFLLGNGAIALGPLEAGCQVMTSYPGTPSSEILPEVVRFSKAAHLNTAIEWSINEKVAFDNAFAAAISGKRAACCMKMVGLNVAADSFMSAAYIGTIGGLVIISCDDPGPHSSQTEQDSRLMARLGKVPVLDPSSPEEAREMIRFAFDLSEEFQVPVLVRPAIRICHARQNIKYDALESNLTPADFKREPTRWASTPKFRFIQHKALNEKHVQIAEKFNTLTPFNQHNLKKGTKKYPFGVVAGGITAFVVRDLFEEAGREDIPVLKLGAPYPFPERLADEFMDACDKVLVIEETDTVIEYMLRDKRKTLGRLTGHVPMEGELVPEKIELLLNNALIDCGQVPLSDEDCGREAFDLVADMGLPIRKPTLCPGCPHRASFYAIRKAMPNAIFPSDIGCYTLGSNLGVVDTVLDNHITAMTETVIYPFSVIMNKQKWDSLPADVQKVMMDLKEEQSLWTGTYMDEQIKRAIAWSKESNNVEFISLSAQEKSQWDGKLDFITEKWIKGATEKGLPAEAIIKDIKTYIQ